MTLEQKLETYTSSMWTAELLSKANDLAKLMKEEPRVNIKAKRIDGKKGIYQVRFKGHILEGTLKQIGKLMKDLNV